MSTVYYSAKDAFETILDDVRWRAEKGWAIYGTGSSQLAIITKGNGTRPDCSQNGPISESEEELSRTGRDGAIIDRRYRLADGIYSELLKNATKDDLYLFMSLANPNTLNSSEVHDAFFDRWEQIKKDEEVSEGFDKNMALENQETEKRTI